MRLKHEYLANRRPVMASEHPKRAEVRRRARDIADPMVVHLRRRSKAVTAEVETFMVEQRRQPPGGLLRERGEALQETLRALVADIEAHLRYLEDPDDPAVTKCHNMRAHATACLNRVRKVMRRSTNARREPQPDTPAARAREAAELDRRTSEESSSVHTITGGLPGLGKRH
ncbi:hypothetical protein [Saccharomonospora cyanea]|uniref:hypothetical protein n=1 Tax=Saccharomonospora cyanea TaxID=40989 RepID=UPI0012FA46BB|nr:hypothetical protein [Saccharomonospora cyanea]